MVRQARYLHLWRSAEKGGILFRLIRVQHFPYAIQLGLQFVHLCTLMILKACLASGNVRLHQARRIIAVVGIVGVDNLPRLCKRHREDG